jgi:hypothetical protein
MQQYLFKKSSFLGGDSQQQVSRTSRWWHTNATGLDVYHMYDVQQALPLE